MYIVAAVIGIVVVVLVGLYLMNRFVWFYRDPVRKPDQTGNVIISPADGQVVYIKRFEADGAIYSEKLGRKISLEELTDVPLLKGKGGWIIGIYMSPFDVHFNYSPISGEVKAISYTKAKMNVPMVDFQEYIRISFLRRAFDNFAARFHLENERNSILIDGKFPVAMIEIADKYVNKISCFVEEGQDVPLAHKVGFIDRGSQCDLIIYNEDITFDVKFGDQVYGGKTVLARY